MLKEEMIRYIRSELGHGTPKDAIVATLVAGGWPPADVEKVLTEVQQNIKKGTYDLPTIGKKPHSHGYKVTENIILWIVFLALAFLVFAYIIGGTP